MAEIMMDLEFVGNNGRVFFRVKLTDTLGDIRIRVNESFGFPPSRAMAIFYAGNRLHDGLTIEECKI